MFDDWIAPVDHENTRDHYTGYLGGFLEFFDLSQHSEEDHGQKVDRTGEKEDHKVKHAFEDIAQSNNIAQRKQERRADIDTHQKPHEKGNIPCRSGKSQMTKAPIIFLFGKACDV